MYEKSGIVILQLLLNRRFFCMKRNICFLLINLIVFSSFTFGKIDKAEYYKALSAGSEASVDQMIQKLESDNETSLNRAYKGTLLMKKAGFIKVASGKVKVFKKGAHLLEDEIKKNPGNAEFRFLRLSVQEHAPGILKYSKNLNEDKAAMIEAYPKLDPTLKSVISTYAESSKIIKLSDLNK